MLGRAPGSIVAIRPLKEGVIANYTVTQKLLAYVIEKVAGKSLFFKPRVMTCVPIGITSVEKRAVMEATTQGGASKTYLIEEPLAAALGAGIDISVPRGNMVVDIGGGTTDIAVLSLGGIVVDSSIRIGGDHFDEAIVRHVKKVHNVLIGERTAEEIKMNVATVITDGRHESITVRGVIWLPVCDYLQRKLRGLPCGLGGCCCFSDCYCAWCSGKMPAGAGCGYC